MTKAILAIDSGTTAAKTAVISLSGRMLGSGQVRLATRYSPHGHAEQDPEEIVSAQRRAMREALAGAGKVEIVAAGVTSQRSTFVIWDPVTGRAIAPAPTWQDTSAADLCHALRPETGRVRRLTGLPLSPHYSASKIAATLRRGRAGKDRLRGRRLLFGSVATWLLWRLTNGEVHATEPTQAARTLLMNLSSLAWDDRLLSIFDVPLSLQLPVIRPGIGPFGTINVGRQRVQVLASLGDQQAALFSHTGFDMPARRRAAALVNYGTGAFVLVPVGERKTHCPGLLSSIAWTTESHRRYLLEGTVNAAGATLDWLRRELGAPLHLDAIDTLCRTSRSDCLLVPAFWRLGSMWSEDRGGPTPSMIAIQNPSDTVAGLTRAAVESLAFMVDGILKATATATPARASERTVVLAGPLSGLHYLAQFQAALCAPMRVHVSLQKEATLLGIARAAAFGLGGNTLRAASRWSSPHEVINPGRALIRQAAERRRSWMQLCEMGLRLGGRMAGRG